MDVCRLQPGYPLIDDVKYQMEMRLKVSSILDVHKTMRENPSKEYPDRWNNKMVPSVYRRDEGRVDTTCIYRRIISTMNRIDMFMN